MSCIFGAFSSAYRMHISIFFVHRTHSPTYEYCTEAGRFRVRTTAENLHCLSWFFIGPDIAMLESVRACQPIIADVITVGERVRDTGESVYHEGELSPHQRQVGRPTKSTLSNFFARRSAGRTPRFSNQRKALIPLPLRL